MNKDIQGLLGICKDVAKFGELATIKELIRHFPASTIEWKGGRNSHDISIDEKRIEVKSCNRDNKWAKKKNNIGFGKIDAKKFEFLVCVAFDNKFEDAKYFVFTREETERFPLTIGKEAKERGLRLLEYPNQDKEIDQLVKNSENAWHKLKSSS